MFAIIKNKEILYFSDEIIEDEDFENIELDEEYNYIYNYILVNGKIERTIKEEFDLEKQKLNRKLEIITKLGELSTQRLGLISLGENLTEIDEEIDKYRLEYKGL